MLCSAFEVKDGGKPDDGYDYADLSGGIPLVVSLLLECNWYILGRYERFFTLEIDLDILRTTVVFACMKLGYLSSPRLGNR